MALGSKIEDHIASIDKYKKYIKDFNFKRKSWVTIVLIAAEQGDIELLKELFDHFHRTGGFHEFLDACDNIGKTAIHYALTSKHSQSCIEILLKNRGSNCIPSLNRELIVLFEDIVKGNISQNLTDLKVENPQKVINSNNDASTYKWENIKGQNQEIILILHKLIPMNYLKI